MLYCSCERGSISIMQLYAQFIATRMYIHFMCAYVYLHLHLFVIPLIYWNAHFKYIKKNLLANCDGDVYLPILHLARVE